MLKVWWLEKSTLMPLVTVVTNTSYDYIRWLQIVNIQWTPSFLHSLKQQFLRAVSREIYPNQTYSKPFHTVANSQEFTSTYFKQINVSNSTFVRNKTQTVNSCLALWCQWLCCYDIKRGPSLYPTQKIRIKKIRFKRLNPQQLISQVNLSTKNSSRDLIIISRQKILICEM